MAFEQVESQAMPLEERYFVLADFGMTAVREPDHMAAAARTAQLPAVAAACPVTAAACLVTVAAFPAAACLVAAACRVAWVAFGAVAALQAAAAQAAFLVADIAAGKPAAACPAVACLAAASPAGQPVAVAADWPAGSLTTETAVQVVAESRAAHRRKGLVAGHMGSDSDSVAVSAARPQPARRRKPVAQAVARELC